MSSRRPLRGRRAEGPLSVVLIGLLAGCAPSVESDGCGEIDIDDHAEPRWVQLDGKPPQRVIVAGGARAVAGGIRQGPQGSAFYPTFPFTPGLTYTASSSGCEASFTVPRQPSVAPHVLGVYPSAAEIPENVLRFYVTFSQAMAEGDFLRHIRLERVDTGEDLTGVFFDNIHELWSPDRTRITLLVDPGRVKTGLIAHDRLGRAFEAGGQYRLHVLPTWTSTRGVALQEGYVHAFAASAEDRERVDPATWSLQLPQAGTRDPLEVDFHEAVDHVCVHRLIQVVRPDGSPLAGRWHLGAEERSATWTPEGPWAGDVQRHQLVVHGRFEDVAANNLNAALDHVVGQRPPGPEGRSVRRVFGL